MIPEWASKYEDEDHIVKKRGNKYFLYEYEMVYEQISTNVYEMYGEPVRRLSHIHSARIIPNGLIINKKKPKPKKRPAMISCDREYGATHLIDVYCSDILFNLKKYFKDDATMIYIMAKQLLIAQPKLEKLHMVYEASYDCITYSNLTFSTTRILSLLNTITHNRVGRYHFLHTYMNHENYFIFTDTYQFETQKVQFLFCFQNHTFSYFRSFHIDQSIDETIENALREINAQNVIWMGDDISLINDIPYIIRLNYDKTMNHHEQYFIYNDRHIYYHILKAQDYLILYDDESCMIYKHGQKIPIALATNLERDVKDIYEMYMLKTNALDIVNLYYDILEDNNSYIMDYNEVGLMFIYYLSMLMYNRIQDHLENSNLSVDEVIGMLKKVTRCMVNYQWYTKIDPSVNIDKIKKIIPEYEKIFTD